MKEVECGDRLLDGWDDVVWVWDMVLVGWGMIFGFRGDLMGYVILLERRDVGMCFGLL